MSKTDPMWVFENYATAAELIDELENSLAQQRLDVARGEKLSADVLEVVGYLLTKGNQLSRMPAGKNDEPLCRLTDHQRLLAQRDAEIAKWKALAQGVAMVLEIEQSRQERSQRLGLESQQAASVGGEREAFEAEMAMRGYSRKDLATLRCGGQYINESIQDRWASWQARTALSPAGGGVVYACPRCGTGMELDSAAKPQANSQVTKC